MFSKMNAAKQHCIIELPVSVRDFRVGIWGWVMGEAAVQCWAEEAPLNAMLLSWSQKAFENLLRKPHILPYKSSQTTQKSIGKYTLEF